MVILVLTHDTSVLHILSVGPFRKAARLYDDPGCPGLSVMWRSKTRSPPLSSPINRLMTMCYKQPFLCHRIMRNFYMLMKEILCDRKALTVKGKLQVQISFTHFYITSLNIFLMYKVDKEMALSVLDYIQDCPCDSTIHFP